MDVDPPKGASPPNSDEVKMEVDSATPSTATEANRGHDGDVPTNEETQRSFAAMEESSSINNDDPAAAGESTTSSHPAEDPQRKESANKASSGNTANSKRIDWAKEVEERDHEREQQRRQESFLHLTPLYFERLGEQDFT